MRFLFIGVYAEQSVVTKLNELSQKEAYMSVAAIKYTRLISEGFTHNVGENCTNLFLVPVGMYPVCKIFYWNKTKIGNDYYIPFINFILIKQLSIMLYLFFFALKWYSKNTRNQKCCIVFSFLYPPFLLAIAPLKVFKNIKTISFVPDMPEFAFSYSATKISFKKFLIPVYIKISQKIVDLNDFYIFITKFMQTSFKNKPFLVIEGFTDANLIANEQNLDKKQNAIMYSGALFEKFGLRMLLDAFCTLTGDYEMWLFGSGDMQDEIYKYIINDKRIKFFGNRPNAEVIEYQKRASLLINPRFTSNTFTKYSFPSKLMEYMSTGTPVLTTRLAGIPDDYNDKMYYIEIETVDGFKESIIKCLSKPKQELKLFGENAKNYVLHKKNNFLQIRTLINQLKIKI